MALKKDVDIKMKLKYYLRGIGVGILITTIVFSFSNKFNKKDKITQEENITNENQNENQKDNLEELIEKSLNSSDKDNSDIDTAHKGENLNNSNQTKQEEANQSPADDDMQMSNEEHDTNLQQEEGETDKEIDYITFSIESGMSSREVAKLLYQNGLIEDVKDFNDYIIENDKAEVIRIGTYTLPKNADYKLILDTIT